MKERQNFPWVCIAMVVIVICLLTEIKSISLKPIEHINIPNKFCLESISEKFAAFESIKVSSTRNMHYFSANHNAIDKSDILSNR